MKNIHFILLLFLGGQIACAQPPEERPKIENATFDNRLSHLLSFTVPVMGVDELEKGKDEMVLLDAREKEEYEVSHIPGAWFLGYKKFSPEQMKDIAKDTFIVLYCSVGYRSEKIGEKLQKMGYTNVHNLYGSIFEWANQDYPLEDKDGNPTKKVHTYNRTWSKWVEDGELIKVW